MSDATNRITILEHQVESLVRAREEDRQAFLNILDKTSKIIEQTNKREDQHFDDMQKLSDRINLVEGMIDIFKKEISEIRGELLGISVEEESDLDEHETS